MTVRTLSRAAWCIAALGLWPALAAAQEIVVFVSDRDGDREVYSMDATGENQTNLTRHPGRDQASALSSDGRRIAWVSDRSGRLGVWIMAVDGSDAQLLLELPDADFGLAWSPADDQIAVTLQRDDDGTHDLALVDVAGRGYRRLTDTPGVEEITPSWSPRGEALYYVAGSGESSALMRVHLGTGRHEVIAANLPSVSFPVVSPDGASVLLRSRTDQFDVLRMHLDSGEIENLTSNRANDWGAVWSRDGKSVFFASDRDGDMEIYVLQLERGELAKLTDNAARDWMPSR